MSKLLLFFALLVSGTLYAQQGDYDVKHGADVSVAHATHYPKMVGVANVRGEEQKLEGIASAPKCAAYFDKTATVFEVKSGETVTPLISINGAWMHGYVYVDWNGNRQFDVVLEGDGPYIKGEGNELVCWSLYNSADGSRQSGLEQRGPLSERRCAGSRFVPRARGPRGRLYLPYALRRDVELYRPHGRL